MTTFALQRDRRQAAPDDFPQQLAELLAYFDDSLPEDHPFARLAGVLPGRPELPVPWLLGSSPQSAIWAGQLALPYAFADFINSEGAEIAKMYRERFVPTGILAGAADRRGRVGALPRPPTKRPCTWSTSSRMSFTLLRQNRLIPVPPPDKAVEFLRREGKSRVGGPARASQHPRFAREGPRRRRSRWRSSMAPRR